MGELVFTTDETRWLRRIKQDVQRHYTIPKQIFSVNKEHICFDIGANIGGFSLSFSDTFDKIYAVEASKTNFNSLLKNCEGLHNIEFHHLAAYSKSDEIVRLKHWQALDEGGTHDRACGNPSITTYKENNGSGFGYHEGAEYELVNSISLEDLFVLSGVDFIHYIKLDIECGEYDFLIGKDLSSIGAIGIEIHAHLGDKQQKLVDHLLNYFKPLSKITLNNRKNTNITFLNKRFKKEQ